MKNGLIRCATWGVLTIALVIVQLIHGLVSLILLLATFLAKLGKSRFKCI